jgi:hypothetical protein
MLQRGAAAVVEEIVGHDLEGWNGAQRLIVGKVSGPETETPQGLHLLRPFGFLTILPDIA